METNTALQERLFKQLKPLEDSTLDELKKRCFHEGFLFRYRDAAGNRVCYCTQCEQEILQEGAEVEGFVIRPLGAVAAARVNDYVHCPACNAPCRVKDAGRSHKYLRQRAYGAVVQKLRNQYIVIRTFCLMRDYGGDYKNVPMLMSEHYRIFYGAGQAVPYRRVNQGRYYLHDIHWFYEQNNPQVAPGLKWIQASRVPPELRYPTGYYWYNHWSYYYDMNEFGKLSAYVLECNITSSKYFKYYDDGGFKLPYAADYPVHKHLECFCKHPVLTERMDKQGFTGELYDALMNRSKANWKAQTVQGFLNCKNKAELKTYMECASQCQDSHEIIDCINAMFWLKKFDLQATAKAVEWFAENFDEYRLNRLKSTEENYTITLDYKRLFSKLIKEDLNLSSYCDYIRWCNKYNVELTDKVLYPRSIKVAHDDMMRHNQRMEEAQRIQKNKEKINCFKKSLLPKYKKIYTFSFGNYQIAPFESMQEIINEGKTQNICVGGNSYTNRYLEGEIVLCKCRLVSEPDKPFVTVEVNRYGAIVQARGYRNSSPPPEVKPFLQQWKAEYTRREKAYKAKHKKKQQKEAA